MLTGLTAQETYSCAVYIAMDVLKLTEVHVTVEFYIQRKNVLDWQWVGKPRQFDETDNVLIRKSKKLKAERKYFREEGWATNVGSTREGFRSVQLFTSPVAKPNTQHLHEFIMLRFRWGKNDKTSLL